MSVPPEKILNPFSDNFSESTLALLITFFVYSLKSSDKASLKQTALAAITCIKGPPCKPGNIALLNFFIKSSLFVRIIPPLGPLKTLCVVEVTTSAMILDAYRALEKLSNHPRIDKDRVSIIGWSLGGAVSLFSGWLPLKNAITKNVSFASHLAFYPPCFIDPENTDFTQSPIHILIGELDDWTPADPCDMFVNKLSKKANINLTVYENSHHGFDSEEPIVFNEKGYSFKDCLFRLDEDGDVLMNFLSLPMSFPLMQKFGYLFCVKRGVNIGGNPEARKKSFEFASSFMSKTLMN